MNEPVVWIAPIERVVIRQQEHGEFDLAAMIKYVECLLRGETLLPIDVVVEDDHLVIKNGRHRFLAHIVVGRNDIVVRT